AGVCAVLPLLVAVFNPLSLSTVQNLLFAAIVLGIALWACELLDRTLVSAALLVVFVAAAAPSGVSLARIFSFPLSANFLTIVSSFLLSAGVVNSGVAKKLANDFLNRFCSNLTHLVIAACLLNALLAAVIPQPVPRITLLGSIYYVLLKDQNVAESQRKAVLFSVFITATTTAMILKNGDVVLNAAALSINNVDMTQTEWLRYMTLPTIAASVLLVAVYILYQNKHLNAKLVMDRSKSEPLTRQGRITCVLMLIIVALWVTESVHGISQAYISLAGVAVMFLLGILKMPDLKSIKIGLLIFLTAEFALGNVLADSGIAASISEILLRVMPASDNVYLPLLLLTLSIYVLHTLFGGAMGALAVSLPIVNALWGGMLGAEVISLTALVLVTCHYVFPYNQMTILVGYGQKYYTFKDVMRFALVLTPLVAFMVFGIYLPWWKLTGLL
ncbi:MAG: anion permease, partial [Firmicutes bacterium]|nr:anion permease [Bacillota bacterium]